MMKFKRYNLVFGFTAINIIVALVLLNILMTWLPTFKIDLTKNKIHTLSPATITTIKELKDLIKVKVYISSAMPPEVKPLANDLKKVLREFGEINKSNLEISYFDPLTNTSIKDEAQRYGIQPLQFSSINSDKLEVQTGYFGLVMIYGDKQEVLPVAGDVGNLEYFLISGIKKLTGKVMNKVVLTQGNGEIDNQETQIFSKYLGDSYQITSVDLSKDEKLSDKSGTLLVIGPNKSFSQKGIEEIGKWLDDKKSGLFLMQPVNVSDNLAGSAVGKLGIEELLGKRGIEIGSDIVLDKSAEIANFRSQSGTFFTQYPYWIKIRPENINQSIPALSGIQTLMFPWASSLVVSNGAKSIISSSEQSWKSDNLTDLSPVSKKEAGSLGKNTVGAIVTDNGRLAVIGNAYFLKDQFVSNNQENLALVFNLIDYLNMDESLLSIRAKTINNPPLVEISDMYKKVIRVGAIASPIFLLILIGFVSYIFRKKNQSFWHV